MYTTEVNIRVRYSETDQMGYCYYGNYAQYFEVARVETLRGLGISYKQLEEDGFFLPVTKYTIKYLKPAYYDENLTIHTFIRILPSVRISFDYETYNEKGDKLNEASTELVFLNKENKKPVRAPKALIEQLNVHFT
ncbi:MAG: acyl-CoA thioester hydrolase [Parvicellaceae bacterium]